MKTIIITAKELKQLAKEIESELKTKTKSKNRAILSKTERLKNGKIVKLQRLS